MQNGDIERAPLLANAQDQPKSRARSFLSETIKVQNAYLQLLICCFTTGFIDAASYNAWSVFMVG